MLDEGEINRRARRSADERNRLSGGLLRDGDTKSPRYLRNQWDE